MKENYRCPFYCGNCNLNSATKCLEESKNDDRFETSSGCAYLIGLSDEPEYKGE